MNLEHKIVEQASRDLHLWQRFGIAKPQAKRPTWVVYRARPFDDRSCPICKRFGCAGC